MSGSDKKLNQFKGIRSLFKKISEESQSGLPSSNLRLSTYENVVSQWFKSQRDAYNQ